ncbi:MAG: bifunctional phosphoribosylaminoimidazolecarboxamide formyltransferase/IMP cyclohydrolase, partial [Phycisphaerales bacterium]|nr:bifunctional phosphoribosylaminoimidazolecarboxamide formyltransferase/IMP cyclohydrolase [Phycisphaerales bacterium]
VGAARVAVEKAGPRLAEAAWPVAASDAFFPFADGPRLLADAGVRCIVQPGGSRRDDETIALCDERSITCLLTGVRHFRH